MFFWEPLQHEDFDMSVNIAKWQAYWSLGSSGAACNACGRSQDVDGSYQPLEHAPDCPAKEIAGANPWGDLSIAVGLDERDRATNTAA
jgi:hypothetical protein